MTSPSHPYTQARVQPIHIYNHTYIKFLPGQNKKSHTKSRQNNLHSVHARTYRIYEQSGPQNTQHFTTNDNAPKGSGSYLEPKTHIQNPHSQHPSHHTPYTNTHHTSTHQNSKPIIFNHGRYTTHIPTHPLHTQSLQQKHLSQNVI